MSADSPQDRGPENKAELAKDLATLNSRIDDIVAFQNRKRPWYRDTALLISGVAFATSIVTSVISGYRTYRQDINSRKDALQTVIQEFYTNAIAGTSGKFSFDRNAYDLNKDAYELQKGLQQPFAGAAYSPSLGPPNAGATGVNTKQIGFVDTNAATEIINYAMMTANNAATMGQNSLTLNNNASTALATKALSLINDLGCAASPDDQTKPQTPIFGSLAAKISSAVNNYWCNASSIDESEVGFILSYSNLYVPSEKLYKRSIGSAQNSIEYLGATRGLAWVEYQTGKKDKGEQTMNQALKVFEQFPDDAVSDEYVKYTNLQTYLMWVTYLGCKDQQASRDKVTEAEKAGQALSESFKQFVGADNQIKVSYEFLNKCPSTVN
jgi:hypothetical protein